MNREQKAATIEALATDIQGAEAIFVVDYRGISVPQVAELRAKLRDADATFKVAKNSLTERAADQVGAETLKPFLAGPTALTFVKGDAALAAKAIADFARATQLLPFKGGLLGAQELDAEQIRSISRLPSREVLYGQLVGVVASPITGLVRTLGALVGGLAVALGQVREKKETGEIPAGEPPAAAVAAAAEEPSPTEDAPAAPVAEDAPAADDASTADGASAAQDVPAAEDAPVAEVDETSAAADTSAPAEEPATEAAATEEPASAGDGESAPEAAAPDQAESASEPAQDDNQADASTDDQSGAAEATKED
jgi:large subunit ribosomal protein L10